MFGACSPTNSRDASSAKQGGADEPIGLGSDSGSTQEQPEIDQRFVPLEKVSSFDLDDQKFSVVALAIGSKTFMNSESSVVIYKLPRDADYVEILRCKHDTILSGGVNPISLVELEISGLSDSEKAQAYRQNNYFRVAEDSKGCELVTDGHLGENFIDSFSPSGAFRYLVRSCVAPGRLIDKERLTSRNCSLRVAISSEVNYTNARKAKEQQALKLTSVYAARIDATTTAMRAIAEDGNEALEECMERNRQRIIDKTIRDAWITMASAVVEVGIELVTISPGPSAGGKTSKLQYYTAGRRSGDAGQLSFSRNLDRLQLLGATQGYLLSDTFIKLFGSSHDMERSCARHDRLINDYFILENSLIDYAFQFHHYMEVARLAQISQLVVDGVEVRVPSVEDYRNYEEEELPPPPESIDDEELESNDDEENEEDTTGSEDA